MAPEALLICPAARFQLVSRKASRQSPALEAGHGFLESRCRSRSTAAANRNHVFSPAPTVSSFFFGPRQRRHQIARRHPTAFQAGSTKPSRVLFSTRARPGWRSTTEASLSVFASIASLPAHRSKNPGRQHGRPQPRFAGRDRQRGLAADFRAVPSLAFMPEAASSFSAQTRALIGKAARTSAFASDSRPA